MRTFDVEIRIDSDGMVELANEHGGDMQAYLSEMIDEDDFELVSAGEGTEKEGYLFVGAVISFVTGDDSVGDIHEALDDYLSMDCTVVSVRERQ